ncbi:MAG TPA: SHOCT domain-containing protein [Allosphingosinicella sp.]
MEARKLVISRGSDSGAPPPRLRAVPPPVPGNEPAAADHILVEHRLAALERLSQLLERGVLTPAEFAAEKALVLRLPADELLLRQEASESPQRSLLGRMFGWPLLIGGVAGGLALSAYAMPQELQQLLRLLS